MSAESEFSDLPLEKTIDFIEHIANTAGTQTGVQLTGGEPTMRADLAQIIYFARARGFWGVEVNTNGLVISKDREYLQDLVAHGLTGIYLQFDGVTPDVYQKIRGVDLLDVKLKAVENCRAEGVQVVLAMTIVSGINDHQIGEVLDYALANSDVIAGVALQPAFTSGRFDAKRVEPLSMGDVIFMLESQTDGLIKAADIWPLGCSHPLCDTGTFLVETTPLSSPRSGVAAGERSERNAGDPSSPNNHTALHAKYTPVTRDLTAEQYLALYNPNSPQGSVFLDILAKQGRPTANGLSVIIMNYMDAYTADLERMEECSMFVTMPNGALIPFCSYQLTNCAGQRVFPPWNIPGSESGVNWDEQ
jgi:uncharacterized radical SAM superfamily Fe-S cluster-containing enzyme